MCRVAVIGNAGGGKSTICKELSEAKGLPLHTVDKLQWKPNWVPAPTDELRDNLDALIRDEFWIIDGWGPWESIEARFKAADTIIFVDHPVWTHFWWALKRQVKAFLFPARLDTPVGCDLSKVTVKLFQMIWVLHQEMRPKLSVLVDSFKGDKTVYHIRSPKELKSFVLTHCH